MLVLIPAVMLAWERLRLLAGFRTPGTGVVHDSVFHLAELALPPAWRPAANLHPSAPIQMLDLIRGRYAIVLSDSRLDFDDTVTLAWHSAATMGSLAESYRVLAIRGPKNRTIGSLSAIQYEWDELHGNTLITRLHTTVEGPRAFHQIVCWATPSRYDRAVFERLLDGFRELPQVVERVEVSTPSYDQSAPASSHTVH